MGRDDLPRGARSAVLERSIEQQTLVRTFVYVGIATVACLLIGYPVAYFIARHARRTKAFFLIAFIAPFWISYMMRMFAWVNLLQPDGYVNRILESFGVIGQPQLWLNGKPSTVIFGLIYGYVPFMILPLFGTLDRIERSTVEAARDLGAGQLRPSSGSRSRCRSRDPGGLHHRGAADVRRLLHADPAREHAADRDVREPDRELDPRPLS